MTADYLLDIARLSLRIVTNDYDEEIDLLIDSALEEMRNCGVAVNRFDILPAPAITAVKIYVKAYFGHDGQNDTYLGMFKGIVLSMKNSGRYPDDL